MEVKSFLAHKLEDVEEYLKKSGIDYELIEVDNPKGVKIGDEKRVIKIVEDASIKIYYSYF
ncbi:hypothetical protein [Caloramator proteoclasticus]|uniref:PASTA domain-containing protein n=1 Tax=Caloramator proteoclasticus DSM 10124 TaxID=1121262 RepID=A0A1M4SKX3_9CLOT|nr:hypothetical protein [Caloramator proteoclasticus]SHE32893.1 hypothetical protein SAMN02746091_00157 [Caloramator proteoclasticus DSM 10124]